MSCQPACSYNFRSWRINLTSLSSATLQNKHSIPQETKMRSIVCDPTSHLQITYLILSAS
ncbi:hypothetical protein GALMADRAFT_584528 [Galerina marginata CBS 339.88]|uniref:Uncharacterized protein n=1 Tax=Galerina marginata (strain CBS 339.88) TaxID=685588 RepID=A0A067T3F1_GALM3|nr:hypothetical protein GALMADRAFT_584528 [Galerina marginata CBS 339.88]